MSAGTLLLQLLMAAAPVAGTATISISVAAAGEPPFIERYQGLIAGSFTLVAGVLAYYAALVQMRSENKRFQLVREEQERAFLTIVGGTIKSYRTNLGLLEKELQELKEQIPRGVDWRSVASRHLEELGFDFKIFESWKDYVTFDIDTIRLIRNCYQDHDELEQSLRELRILATRREAPLPLLRSGVADRKLDEGQDRLDEAEDRLEKALVAVADAKASVEALIKKVETMNGESVI